MPTAVRRAGRRKSTYSDQGNGCLEVNFTSDGIVELSDSKLAESPMILFTLEQWASWLDEVVTGELTNMNGSVTVTVQPNAWSVRALAADTTLVFTNDEWTAFRLGAGDGEFDPSIAHALAMS